MCKKVKNKRIPNTRIDKCMKNIVNFINHHTRYKTLACCCGHGKYPMTIVIKMKGIDHDPIELMSNQIIRRSRNFYKKDKQGYYYIPETIKKTKI